MCDTGPLITLAVADALDYLLFVQADIVIPDAVLYEATHDAAELGAQDIIDWVKVNRARIELATMPPDPPGWFSMTKGWPRQRAAGARPTGAAAYG